MGPEYPMDGDHKVAAAPQMSAEPDEADGFELSLDRSEAWVVHHAILDHVELVVADDESPTRRDLTLLEKLETGTHVFTAPELVRVRELCTDHWKDGDVPQRDVAAATAVVDEIDAVLADHA